MVVSLWVGVETSAFTAKTSKVDLKAVSANASCPAEEVDHRPVYVVRLTRTVTSNGAHQEIEFENPIRMLYLIVRL
jgi:hypothetical protein